VDEVRRAHPGQDIRLETVGDGRALIDRDRLAQVVSNLLGNAVEHGDRSRPVTVELAANGDAVGLLVHNAGSPIPPELLPVIFDPFRRTGGPDKRSRGLGLGLFISQQIVLAHRGRIDVRSTVELGTTFTVTLPRLAIEKLASPDGHLVA
jgi:signal transduction histidine kinase